MSERRKQEWLRDIEGRQKNTVFPDTVRNEGNFWRNLWARQQPLNLVQWAGLFALAVFWVWLGTFFLYIMWPEYEGPWWRKLVDGYAINGTVLGAVILFVVLGNRRARKHR